MMLGPGSRGCFRSVVMALATAWLVSLAGVTCAQAPAPGFERRTTPGDQPELPEPTFRPPAPRFELPPLRPRLSGGSAPGRVYW